jgi:hypothetical protein
MQQTSAGIFFAGRRTGENRKKHQAAASPASRSNETFSR